MPSQLTADDIRELVEDEVALTSKEIKDALTILRHLKRHVEKTGDDPDKLGLVIALIRLLEKKLTRLGEISLAQLGQAKKIENAVKELKQQRKKLGDAVDAGLSRAKDLESAEKIAKALGGAVDRLAKLAK